MQALVVSADPKTRELMAVAVGSVERALGEPVEFLEASDGLQGIRRAFREAPDIVVAEETLSRAGGFALAKELRGALEPYPGVIVLLLDRPHDAWLAKWSGADAWFVKPPDPFAVGDAVAELVRRRRAPTLEESA